jgi:2-keto-4-pentenoate hydratase/2-oxohepta-3-ene-1,7-dioic acid hydratase in catechol pathway
MRWIRYTFNQVTHYGIIRGDKIQQVLGDPFNGFNEEAIFIDIDKVKIEIPVLPRTFYCAGLNYSEHVIESAKKQGIEPVLPSKADIGYRANNALIAHMENVIIPKDATEKIHYEGELVVVIGKKVNCTFAPANPADPIAVWCRNSRILESWGWSPEFNLKESISSHLESVGQRPR